LDVGNVQSYYDALNLSFKKCWILLVCFHLKIFLYY
jgi:hypothetical protein